MYSSKEELADAIGVSAEYLYTAKEAAARLGISPSTVYRRAKHRTLERHKAGGEWHFVIRAPKPDHAPPPAPSPDCPGIPASRLLAMSDEEIEELDKELRTHIIDHKKRADDLQKKLDHAVELCKWFDGKLNQAIEVITGAVDALAGRKHDWPEDTILADAAHELDLWIGRITKENKALADLVSRYADADA